MKAFKNIKEMQQALKEVNSCAAETDRFMACAFPLLIEKLDALVVTKRKREATAWNKFASKGLKAGKSMAEIAKEWRLNKRGDYDKEKSPKVAG